MIFAFLFLIIIVALWIDVLWLPTFFCAVATMQWTASLHLPDPLAPLYACFIGGVTARTVLAIAFHRLRREMA